MNTPIELEAIKEDGRPKQFMGRSIDSLTFKSYKERIWNKIFCCGFRENDKEYIHEKSSNK